MLVKGRVEQKSEAEIKLMALEAAPFEATADFGVVKLRVDARQAPATLIDELKTPDRRVSRRGAGELMIDTSAGAQDTAASGPEYRVQPDGDFFAEAKALLGEAALIA